VPVNFDQSKEITISGTFTEAKWINPHSRFRIDVKQDDGTTVEWLVEMGAVQYDAASGFEIEKFVVGDTLTIIGWPGRDRESNDAAAHRCSQGRHAPNTLEVVEAGCGRSSHNGAG
jgi:hypothetical protein